MDKVFLLVVISLVASCGGPSDNVSVSTASKGGTGSIKAVVTGSRSFDPNIFHGRIVNYKVTITGEGISEPIVAEFDGAAT